MTRTEEHFRSQTSADAQERAPSGPEPSAAMKPSQVLDAAADLIEPEGAWTQGQYFRGKSGRSVSADSPYAMCFCAIGAMMRVSLRDESDSYPRARHLLTRVIGWDYVADWNDRPERTQSEVVQALRAAAELARSEGR